MADIPIQTSGEITFQAAAAGGDSFVNDGKTLIFVIGPSAAFSLSFANGRDCNFGPHTPHVLTIADGATSGISDRFSASRFNDADSRIAITYPLGAVGVQVAAVRTEVLFADPT